nr:serine/arginine repetitive matrix protein 2-like [Ipomoea batatas]
MSDSDSQNVSGRDYDEGDEAGYESSSPSTGGSTFDQIDEVQHVSADAEENEGPLQTAASSKDVNTTGGAPRELRASRRISSLEASSRAQALSAPGEASSSLPSLPQPSALPAPAVASSSSPEPSETEPADVEPATTWKKMLFLNSEVVKQQKRLLTRARTDEIHALLRGRIPYKVSRSLAAKISSEVYDYLIFRTPEGYKKANLEPPDYGRSEKYELVPIATPTAKGSSAEPSQDMAPDKAFIAPTAAPRPKTKVALGAKKAAAKPAADPPVTHGQSRQGKEKRQEPEIEEIRDKVPDMETIMGWSCNRLGEHIAEDILRLTHTTTDLFCQAWALEGIREKEVVPLQKQVTSAEKRIQELEEELAVAEGRAEKAEKGLTEAESRAEKAEQAEKEAIDKMKDANNLAQFIYTDEAVAKEFLSAFINTEVGDQLTWVYGQWAFSSGCRAIQEQVHTALTEGLEETDLPEVKTPHGRQTNTIGHLTPEMGTLLPSASKAIRSADQRNRVPYSQDGHLDPIGLEGHKANAIGYLTPKMGTLLPSASKAIRSADLHNRAPYSRDGHLAPIGREGLKVGRPTQSGTLLPRWAPYTHRPVDP